MNYKILAILFLTIVILIDTSTGNEVINDKVNNFASSLNLPELTVYEATSGAPENLTFSVFVRFEGGEWIDLHEYNAPVDGGGDGLYPRGNMSFVLFDSDFSKKIDVKVVNNSGTISNVNIRPTSAKIEHTVDSDTVQFSLTNPKKLSVEINGDSLNNLMVFANSLETDKLANDEYTYYFAPGIHKLGGDGKGLLELFSDESVYIAGGAIVYGHIKVMDPSYQIISNVSITGRGILSGDLFETQAYNHPEHGLTPALIQFNIVDNANIEGIILHNTSTWNVHLNFCSNVTVRDLKIMSWSINSDGINPQVSRDILIDNCFIRNHDDCSSIKLNWYQGNNILDPQNPSNNIVSNITIQNSIYWTDQGRAVLIGPEMASTVENHVLENITVRNMDILYVENYNGENTDWAKGAMAINCGDNAIVRNVLFDDIRIERIGSNTNLITINMVKTPFSGYEGQRIEDIIFRNITSDVVSPLPNYIQGYDTEKIVSGVTFNNLKINGLYINNAIEGDFDINEFTKNIQFTTVVSVTENQMEQLPKSIVLEQNYPNPFNPSTTIKYSVPSVGTRHASSVRLKIYDILGREVTTLVNREQKAGNYEVIFNANNLTSGVYFYRLQSGSFIESKKMILLR